MTYRYDNYETNEIHANDRDESRCALSRMTEMGRVQACSHHYVRGRSGAVACQFCGDALGGDEL